MSGKVPAGFGSHTEHQRHLLANVKSFEDLTESEKRTVYNTFVGDLNYKFNEGREHMPLVNTQFTLDTLKAIQKPPPKRYVVEERPLRHDDVYYGENARGEVQHFIATQHDEDRCIVRPVIVSELN